MNIIYGDDHSITIGQNIGTLNISGDRIIVDGKDITDQCSKNGTRKIGDIYIKGDVKNIICHNRLDITGNVGSFESHGSATVNGTVKGDITSHGSLICGKVEGNVTGYGSVIHR